VLRALAAYVGASSETGDFYSINQPWLTTKD